MNLAKVKREFKKARRTMFGPAPDMRAVTSMVTVTKRVDPKKPLHWCKELYSSVSFYMGSKPITIHGDISLNSSEGKGKEHIHYLRKLNKLEDILSSGLAHLGTGNEERYFERAFLNHEDADNDYGSSILLIVPPVKDGHLFCTLEISSCHFKARMNPTREELGKYINFMLKGLRKHMDDCAEGIEVWGK